jgi:hypothetical protein
MFDQRARRRAMRVRRTVSGVIAAVVAGGVFLAGGTAPASRPGTPRAVVVGPGETVWELSARYVPAGIDTRAYVDAVIALNDLDGGLIVTGQRVRLPR